MRILVSLPVHEHPEVVRDQLRNFLRFLRDPIIVLHVSASFDVDIDSLIVSDRVLVNPERIVTAWGTGILARVHLSNMRFALAETEFDTIALHASNDLFIREGVEDYIDGHAAGATLKKLEGWWWRRRSLGDRPLAKYLQRNGLAAADVAHIEGTFYRRDVLEKMLQSLKYLERKVWWRQLTRPFKLENTPLPLNLNPPYPREELYFPTALSACGIHPTAAPYVYMNWERQLTLTIDEIEAVRRRDYDALPDFDKPQGGEFFAVKRVPRAMDDPIRLHIDALTAGA